MLTVFVMALPIANMFCLLGGAWHLRSKEPDTAAAWQFPGCRGLPDRLCRTVFRCRCRGLRGLFEAAVFNCFAAKAGSFGTRSG